MEQDGSARRHGRPHHRRKAGPGRAHAVVAARESAGIVLIDTTRPFTTVPWPSALADDMAETAGRVEALDRRVLPIEAGVRDQEAQNGAVASGIAEFGRIDHLIAIAGIWTLSK